MTGNRHVGSDFADLLREEGIADEVNAAAIKRVLTWQLQEAMRAQGVSKSELARRMRTSRSQVARLLEERVDIRILEGVSTEIGDRLEL
jgi:predicted DNA-binding protein (UPF0251 family)